MKKQSKLILTGLFLFLVTNVFSQKFTLSGYVMNEANGEKLLGASVYIKSIEQGTATNAYGFYSLTLPKGEYEILYSYVGFEALIMRIKLTEDISKNIKLSESVSLKEVVVTDDGGNKIEDQTQMSTLTISMEKVKSLPAFMGEQDLIKTLQLLPGVQSGGEGQSGLYVRGGGPDQNLILLDGVPVYNASHLFGFFSVFNADAINSVELTKGGFPARYGGRLSSVLDIRMKEGNLNKFEGEGSVGLISSKLSLQGPIIKDKTSFIVSARRTYIDILTRPLIQAVANQQGATGRQVAGYYFYDFNGKINHKFSDRSRLYFSTYSGDDKFYVRLEENYIQDGNENTFKTSADLSWGNTIAALRWNYMITPKLFSNTTVTYSQYKFDTGIEFSETFWENGRQMDVEYLQSFYSGIDDWTAKVDFDYLPNTKHYIRFGAGDIYHRFSPGVQQLKVDFGDDASLDSTSANNTLYAHEAYAYIEDDFKVGARLKINAGLHATAFIPSDTSFFSLQPRIAIRYKTGPNSSLKASYAKMRQHLHLLANPTIGLPTDLWLPATKLVPPETSHQIAIGYAQTVKEKYEVSAEVYYKEMDNLIEYKDGASFGANGNNWEDKVEIGRGWSYGLEVLLEKKLGKFSGWIGYTLSWTDRQFENLNFGESFPYKYDRRHDVSVAMTYKKNENVDFGLVWIYGTGSAYTLGLERYQSIPSDDRWQGINEIEHIGSRNNFRAPSYHRLDLGVNLHKKRKWGTSTWHFGIYNTYNRLNPFYIYWGYDNSGFIDGSDDRVLKQVSIFPMIPSIAYSFKF